MSYLDRIRACNRHDIAQFRRFSVAGEAVGWVRHGFAEALRQFPAFRVAADGVALDPGLDGLEARSAALAEAVSALVAQGAMAKPRHEDYAVVRRWGEAPLARLDRAAVPYFGAGSFGLHVNGFVRKADGIHLWVGHRALDRSVAPGKLDNLIAGGLPFGLSLAENLVKEAGEEAGMAPELARRAVPVGCLSYCLENAHGLKPDVMFLYDLELDAGFVPRNADGEVARFELVPVAEVARIVRETDDFKFNCNLVIIDFLVRHGLIQPDEPDYVAIVTGLRRPLPGMTQSPHG